MESLLEARVFSAEEAPLLTDRVWVAKNMSKENVEVFDKFFVKFAELQNKEPGFTEKVGTMVVECLSQEAHKRILTKEERKKRKSEYNIKRNQLPHVKKQRKENESKPENKKKREEANQAPGAKRNKSLSGTGRRRALRAVKDVDPTLYEKVLKIGREVAEEEERVKTALLTKIEDSTNQVTEETDSTEEETTMSE